jgi:hypothetical protein
MSGLSLVDARRHRASPKMQQLAECLLLDLEAQVGF